MELLTHDMTALFAQLGLANDDISLHRFIREHPLDNQTLLPDATFWTASQAGFLRDALWMNPTVMKVAHNLSFESMFLYAVGIILFELLTGRQPYTAATALQVAYRHVHEREQESCGQCVQQRPQCRVQL